MDRPTTPLRPGWNTVTVDDFEAAVAPIGWYGSLSHMAGVLLADPWEKAVIWDLVSVLESDGRFRYPIRVEDGELGNGCHRFVATLLAGGRWIDCWVVDADHPDPGWARLDNTIEISFRVTPRVPMSADDCFDVLHSTVRSFPLDNDTWAETDSFSSSNGVYEVAYYLPAHETARMCDALVTRLAAANIDVTICSVVNEPLEPVPA